MFHEGTLYQFKTNVIGDNSGRLQIAHVVSDRHEQANQLMLVVHNEMTPQTRSESCVSGTRANEMGRIFSMRELCLQHCHISPEFNFTRRGLHHLHCAINLRFAFHSGEPAFELHGTSFSSLHNFCHLPGEAH